ncbi:MAG TPA: acetate kinase, partial [Marinilabiliaceae bacterium]|nr:acetate kinase [Marinilabiliaceae bacterium]
GDEAAKMGMEMYTYRIKKYIGSYAAVMGGVDTIVFTGGIGENGDDTRASICEGLEFIGVKVDAAKNKGLRSKEADFSVSGSKVRLLVVPTNEELVIAQDTMEIVQALASK